MNTLITILLFILLLSIIIVIHELGHLFTAKMFGVYCYEFAFGMGPKLWSHKGRETEYSIRAIPIGGFVTMAGENDGSEEIYPDAHVDPSRTLPSKKPWQRIIIMLAGVAMNFILAVVIFSFIILGNGGFAISPKAEVASVTADSPAEKAGIQAGDIILKAVNSSGSSIKPDSFLDLQMFLSSETSEVEFTLQRGNETVNISVTPEYNAEIGSYMIGISAPESEVVKVNILNCWVYGCAEFGYIAKMMLWSIGNLFKGIGLNDLSGPVGIYNVTAAYASMGFASYMFLVAELSINIGLVNLLPLPVLDGGRAIITIGEWIAHKKLNQKVELALMSACWVLLIGLMVFVTWNDLVRLFG